MFLNRPECGYRHVVLLWDTKLRLNFFHCRQHRGMVTIEHLPNLCTAHSQMAVKNIADNGPRVRCTSLA